MDEYMNPKMGNSMPGPSRLGSSSTAGADMLGPMHSKHHWDRDLRKFGDPHRLGTYHFHTTVDYLQFIVFLELMVIIQI